MWSRLWVGCLSFKIALETKEREVTEAAMRQVLDKTRKFAERQRLLKELWRAQGAASVKENEKDAQSQRDGGGTRA